MDDPTNSLAALANDHEFLLMMARYADGLVSEAQVRKRYRLPEQVWADLGQNDELAEAIELEKQKRIRSGATARERAQSFFAAAPTVLGGIMNDGAASPRHRIESVKELRQIADNGPETAPAASAEKFVIRIVLGPDPSDTLEYPISPKVIEHSNDTHNSNSRDNDDADEQQLATPWGLFMTATNKQGSDGNGSQSI